MNEYFPKKTDPQCQLKWNWSTIWFNDGTTASCHRCDRIPISPSDFKYTDFHNKIDKMTQREEMLAGQWPKGGCDYCKKIEESGGMSDRQFNLQIPNLTPPELKTNPETLVCTPTVLEVFLANTCNLQCIYCRPENSSRIESDVNMNGPYLIDVHTRNNYNIRNDSSRIVDQGALKTAFWEWMASNSIELRRFHILGGEPFYQKDFIKCLNHWKQFPNPLLELNIVTNLMIAPNKFQQHIKNIKEMVNNHQIKRFDLTASIDCWGDDQVYVRDGIDLQAFEDNMKYLLEQDESWLRINIQQTLSALTIHSAPAMIKKLNEWKKKRSVIGHYYQNLTSPYCMALSIFPKGYWDSKFNEILSVMTQDNWDDKQVYSMMAGTATQISTSGTIEGDSDQLHDLYKYLEQIDKRRGLNWKKAFPYLIDILEENETLYILKNK